MAFRSDLIAFNCIALGRFAHCFKGNATSLRCFIPLLWFSFSSILWAISLIFSRQTANCQTCKKLRSTNMGLMAIAIVFLSANYLLFLIGLSQTSPANTQVFNPISSGDDGIWEPWLFLKNVYTLYQWMGLGVLTLGFFTLLSRAIN